MGLRALKNTPISFKAYAATRMAASRGIGVEANGWIFYFPGNVLF